MRDGCLLQRNRAPETPKQLKSWELAGHYPIMWMVFLRHQKLSNAATNIHVSNVLSFQWPSYKFPESRQRKVRDTTSHSAECLRCRMVPSTSTPSASSCVIKSSIYKALHLLFFSIHLWRRDDTESLTCFSTKAKTASWQKLRNIWIQSWLKPRQQCLRIHRNNWITAMLSYIFTYSFFFSPHVMSD